MSEKILTIIPMKPQLHPVLRAKAIEQVYGLLKSNPDYELGLYIDSCKEPKLEDDSTPWSRVCRVRNRILDSIRVEQWDWLLWIDADVVQYPADLLTRLRSCAANGVISPMVYIENTNVFYDWSAFIIKDRDHIAPGRQMWLVGRNLTPTPPYWVETPQTRVVPMDCVGTITMVHTSVYMAGARYEDHPTFTDHYPICKKARELNLPVVVDTDTSAYHANLPNYGEDWH